MRRTLDLRLDLLLDCHGKRGASASVDMGHGSLSRVAALIPIGRIVSLRTTKGKRQLQSQHKQSSREFAH